MISKRLGSLAVAVLLGLGLGTGQAFGQASGNLDVDGFRQLLETGELPVQQSSEAGGRSAG